MFRLPDKVQHNLPYFSQWESAELIEQFVNKELTPLADPAWQLSGALTVEEYEYWCWHICGMACLKMILKDKFGIVIPTIDLAKKCAEYGGYVLHNGNIEGLMYKPFSRFVSENYKLQTKVKKYLLLRTIKKELASGNYVIASVNPEIRKWDQNQQHTIKRGGHLVLMTGYDTASNTVSFHNSSGFYPDTQTNHIVPEKVFKHYFAYRGILIKK